MTPKLVRIDEHTIANFGNVPDDIAQELIAFLKGHPSKEFLEGIKKGHELTQHMRQQFPHGWHEFDDDSDV
jgi:hypothetical protein